MQFTNFPSAKIFPLQPISWSYIAGYFDGEGCFILSIYQEKRIKFINPDIDGYILRPQIYLQSYDLEVLSAIQTFLRLEDVSVSKFMRIKKKQNGMTQDSIGIAVCSYGGVARFIEKISPHIIQKRPQLILFNDLMKIYNQRPLARRKRMKNLPPQHKWDKISWLKAMEVVDKINSYKSRKRGKYNLVFFQKLWNI